MTHPQMFDDDDPFLAKVRSLSLQFPGAAEKVSHGRPTFFTKKVFVYYGASVRSDAGTWLAHRQCVLVQLDGEERPAATQDPRFFSPAYLGPYGWLGIDLEKRTDWGEIAELIESSYRQTAPAKLIARFDALK
jgi:predicted DNA-binding protein (MmcQ/YjbR family)